MDNKEPISQRIKNRYRQLEAERSVWMTKWQQINRHITPRNGRFLASDRNKKIGSFNHIEDSTATDALKVLASGMHSGMTSPARPWFALTLPQEMQDQPFVSREVSEYLSNATKVMLRVFAQTNLYRALHTIYLELGAFGTAACFMLEDEEHFLHFSPCTAGEYLIATDWRGTPNCIYRRFQKTVMETVTEFGLDNCSRNVQEQFNNRQYQSPVMIIHAVEENNQYDPQLPLDALKGKRFLSIYIEETADDENSYLRAGGFDNFPAVCPRWEVNSDDVYGQSPAMQALGDVIQLQKESFRKGQCIDYQTKPPLQAPSDFKGHEFNMLPGGISFIDSPIAPVQPIFNPTLNLQHLTADIQQVQMRIHRAFYTDIFRMLSNVPNDGRMTATEVAERREEKMTMLSPTLDRLQNELLQPIIDFSFMVMFNRGLFGEVPAELQGQEIGVEFTSILAQAQRAYDVNKNNRLIADVGNLAGMNPEVLDMIDFDKVVKKEVEALGVDPDLLKKDSQIKELREQRKQQQQAMQEQQMAMEQAKAGITPDPLGASQNIIEGSPQAGNPLAAQALVGLN